jgi:hypothetical protein
MIEGRHLRAIAHRPSAVGNNQRVLPIMNRLLPDIEEKTSGNGEAERG